MFIGIYVWDLLHHLYHFACFIFMWLIPYIRPHTLCILSLTQYIYALSGIHTNSLYLTPGHIPIRSCYDTISNFRGFSTFLFSSFLFLLSVIPTHSMGTQFHTPSLSFPPICRPIFLAKIINAMTQDNVHDMFFWAMGLSISTFM